jgi:beta-lactamase regulating signal transducer with metallopeptidase domain
MIREFVDATAAPALAALAEWSIRWGVLIAALALLMAARPPRRAATRHLLALVVLGVGLALPWLPRWGSGLARPPAPTPRPAAPARPDPADRPAPPEPAGSPALAPAPAPIAATAPPAPPDAPPPARRAPAPPPAPEPFGLARAAILALAALWALGTALALLRLALGWAACARLLRGASPAGEADSALLEGCRAALGLRRPVRLAIHPALGSPVAVVGRRPAVLVPEDWGRLPEPARRAALLHELAHLRRRDDWARPAQGLVRAPFWFHPGVRWLLGRLDREREWLCDEAAVACGVPAPDYARILLDFARRPRLRAPEAGAIPFLSRGTVKARIDRLLEDDAMRWMSPLPRGRALALALAALGVAAGLGSVRVVGGEPPSAGAEAEPGAAPSDDDPPGELRLKGDATAGLSGVAFSPDGTLIATGGVRPGRRGAGHDGEVRVWDARTGRLLHETTVEEVPFEAVAFSPDGKTLAVATPTGVRLFQTDGLRPGRTMTTTEGLPESFHAVAFSPDGKTLAAGGSHGPRLLGQGGYVQLWDADTGAPRGVLDRGTTGVISLAFAEDGRRLFEAAGGGIDPAEIALWDFAGPAAIGLRPDRVGQVVARMEFNTRDPDAGLGANAGVDALAVSPDGALLAAGGMIFRGFTGDGDESRLADPAAQVKLYDAHTGALVRTLAAPGGTVLRVAFSPDGRALAAIVHDEAEPLVAWAVADGRGLAVAKPDRRPTYLLAAPDGLRTARWDDGDVLVARLDLPDDPPAAEAPRPKPEPSVLVHARVVDAETGAVIRRFVEQGGMITEQEPGRVTWGFSETRTEGENPEGTFTATLGGANRYRVRVIADGYVPEPVPVDPSEFAEDAEVSATVKLRRGREVAGRVLDFEGEPVAGATVFLVGGLALNITGGRAIGSFGGEEPAATKATTDARGRFALTGADGDDPANPLQLAVSAPGLDAWAVPAPEPGKDAAIELPRPARLTLRYAIEGDEPEAEVLLQLIDHGWNRVSNERRVLLRNGESLALDDLTPGHYDITRIKNVRVGDLGFGSMLDRRRPTLDPGGSAEVAFARPDGRRVPGRVVGLEGTGAPGALVTVRDAKVVEDDPFGFERPRFDALGVGKDGRFTTARLDPGTYEFQADAYLPQTPEQRARLGLRLPDLVGSVVVTVPEGDAAIPEVAIELKPNPRLKRGE